MSPAIGSAARHYRLWVAVAALAAVACSDGGMSPEDAAVLAKGGPGGPSVNAVDPNSAPQDTTLEVRVIGSGFDEGSTVTFLLAGESTPKIVTNSSQFVSSDTLIANISVAADADTALYDIQVTTSRGKKGQGSELFQVTVKGGKPGDEIVYVHTLHDFGTDRSLRAINDNGIMVGTSGGQAAVWWGLTDPIPLLLPDPVGAGSWGTSVNSSATQVVGEYWNAAQTADVGVLWDVDPNARTVLDTRELPPLAGYDGVTPSGLNDLGQVVGQSNMISDVAQQTAVIWEADGSGAMVPRALGDLPGHPASWARAINNAGHVVGRSGLGSQGGTPRAVLWFLEADGSVSGPLDLTPDSDDSGDNHALDLTEPVAGAIWISGYSNLAPDGNRTTVWKVDLALRQVVERIRSPIGLGGGFGGRMNDALEVSGMYSDFNGIAIYRGAVWQPVTGVVTTLPSLSLDCNSQVNDINGSGTLVGRSSVRVKARGGWSCVQHAVVWTKN